MSVPRRILIVHPDAMCRQELRSHLTEEEVVEASSRQEATQYLSWAPTHVVAHHREFSRLLRDLERHVPGAIRAVLAPEPEDDRQELVEVAARGYEFVTLDAPQGLRTLLQTRASVRHRPLSPLIATFRVGDERFTARVADLADDGLGLQAAEQLAVERLTPSTRLLDAAVMDGARTILQGRVWVVRTVRPAAPGTGIWLGVAVEPAPVDDPSSERVSDAVRVRALLRRAARRGRHFDLQTLDGRPARRFLQASADRSGEHLTLSCPISAHGSRLDHSIARLSFEFGGVQLEGLVAVVSSEADLVRITKPDSLTRHHRRASLRVDQADGLEASIRFRSPLGGSAGPRRLLDLHPSGASFAYSADECFPAGLMLDEVVIDVQGRLAQGRATVKTTSLNVARANGTDGPDMRRCGLVLHDFPPGDQQIIRDALLRCLAAEVSDGGLEDFDTLWELFCAEDDTFPDYPPDDDKAINVLRETHRILGTGAHGLSKSFVAKAADGQVIGHASGLRVYSGTWLAQHLVVRSGYHRQLQVSQSLVNLVFDYGEALGDIEYTRGLWRTANRWSSRVFGTVTAKLLRPGLSCLSTYWPMRLPPRSPVPGASVRARAARDSDVPTFLAHLRKTRDAVWLRANDMTESELNLRTLSGRYSALTLRRSRTLVVVDGPSGSEPRGWALLEDCSPGLFWAEFFSGFQLYLVDANAPDSDHVRAALVDFALRANVRPASMAAECMAWEEDVPSLERMGFSSLGQVIEYDAHRTLTRDITTQVHAVFEKIAARQSGGTP